MRYEAAAAPAEPARPRWSAPQDGASALGYAPPQDSVTAGFKGDAGAVRSGDRTGKAGTASHLATPHRVAGRALAPTQKV